MAFFATVSRRCWLTAARARAAAAANSALALASAAAAALGAACRFGCRCSSRAGGAPEAGWWRMTSDKGASAEGRSTRRAGGAAFFWGSALSGVSFKLAGWWTRISFSVSGTGMLRILGFSRVWPSNSDR